MATNSSCKVYLVLRPHVGSARLRTDSPRCGRLVGTTFWIIERRRTTGVACIRTGRNFIGVEKDELYFEIAWGAVRNDRDYPIRFHFGSLVAVELHRLATVESARHRETQPTEPGRTGSTPVRSTRHEW